MHHKNLNRLKIIAHDEEIRVFFFFILLFSVVKQWIARKKRGKRGDEIKPRWEQDYELIPNEGLFGEYLEMGI